MLAVLRAKFRYRTTFARALMNTGEVFLLEHNSKSGRDSNWSNNNIGDGTNWLGLQLMIVRDELLKEEGKDATSWSEFIGTLIDFNTSEKLDDPPGKWQLIVKDATDAARIMLGEEPTCKRIGCGKPAWSGKANQFCRRCEQMK